MKASRILALGVLALVIQQVAFAAGTSMPASKTENGITYVSGGIGEEEAVAMKTAAKHYDLMLTFAERGTGAYLADVKVKVNDQQGKTVLNTVSDGPIFLAKLPDGKYTIEVNENGKSLTRIVRVNHKHHDRLTFYWPAQHSG
jgi:hypothetical protein